MRSECVWFTNYPGFLSRHENKWIRSPLQLRSFSQGWRGRLFGPVACPCESGEKAAAYVTWEDSFKSLFCSKEFCCLILFFPENVICRPLVLPHCSLLGCTMFPRLGKVLYKLHTGISPCVGVRARPGRSHSISNWSSSSLEGRDRSGEWYCPHAMHK